MLIGFCGSIEQAELAKSCGFDYLEPGITTICAMSEEEFAEKQAYLQRVGLPVLTANLFLPGDWPLGHAPSDEERNRAYLKIAAERLSRLGVKGAVLGSGGARELSDDFGREKGKEQFKAFYRQASEILGEKGIFVAIEPLCKKECNFLNTVKETFDLLQSLPEGPKGINCDFYHAGQENEALSVLNRAGAFLRHCHIAHPVTRKAPLPDDGADYLAIFQALKDCGYDGTISFEGDWENNPVLLQASAVFLKKTAKEVFGVKAV